MEQPRDYVDPVEEVPVQTIDDWFAEEYAKLGFFERVLYRMQNHVILVMIISITLGYLAGTYFGTFW